MKEVKAPEQLSDPVRRLAEEIESCPYMIGTFVPPGEVADVFTDGQRRLIAAALRLADVLDRGARDVGTYYWVPFRHEGDEAVDALVAYRVAKEAM